MTSTSPTSPCREWQGASDDRGYGKKRDKELRKTVLVHRWVVAQVEGWDALGGKAVMHLCDNPRCYRYDHLRIGTWNDNNQDMKSKRRASRGSAHVKSKLTEQQVMEIFRSPERQEELARRFGVTQSNISKIKNGHQWSHLTQGEQQCH